MSALHTKWVYKTKPDPHRECEPTQVSARRLWQRESLWYRLQLDVCGSDGLIDRQGHPRACGYVGVPSKHGDHPSAYVEVKKEDHLDNLPTYSARDGDVDEYTARARRDER